MTSEELNRIEGDKLVVEYPQGVIHGGVARAFQDYVYGVLNVVLVGDNDSGYQTVAEVVGDEQVTLRLGGCDGEGIKGKSLDLAGGRVRYLASQDWVEQWGDGTGIYPDDYQVVSASVAVVGRYLPEVRRGSFNIDTCEADRLYRLVIDFVGKDIWEQLGDEPHYRRLVIQGRDEPRLRLFFGDIEL